MAIEGAVKLDETSRTYTFPGGDVVALEHVTELIVRGSGSHRLKTKDGKLHIVPAGWVHVEIVAASGDWTV